MKKRNSKKWKQGVIDKPAKSTKTLQILRRQCSLPVDKYRVLQLTLAMFLLIHCISVYPGIYVNTNLNVLPGMDVIVVHTRHIDGKRPKFYPNRGQTEVFALGVCVD